MSEFESIGTIHYRVSGKGACLFFVPDSNHSLKYSDKSYAVFVIVPPPAGDDIRNALAVPLRNDKNGGILSKKYVPIEIPCPDKMGDVLQVALQAAEKQAAVTVTVKRNNESLELVGITFPAR